MSIEKGIMFSVLGIMLSLLFGLFNNNVSVEGLAVNWGTIASHPLPPKVVVKLLQDNGINKVKLFDSNPKILEALAGSEIEVMIAIPNLDLKIMADPAKAKAWVAKNVTSYKVTSKDGVKITNIAIGNEPFLKDYGDMFVNATFPALKNIQDALNDAGVGNVVKATIPFNADVYESPVYNPVPSAGEFRANVTDQVVEILEYMNKNKAAFLVNIYPFLSVVYGKGEFPIDFAFFDGKGTPMVDGKIEYTNVFDAMIDTLAAALSKVGFKDMPIQVGEIGWPTNGDVNANISMAERFYNGMISKILSNKGTPVRPGPIEVYLFALFDEDQKSVLPGNFERSWGIYRSDGRPKFPLVISANKGQNKTLASVDIPYLPKQWCVAKPGSDQKGLSDAMKYACDRTDCTPTFNGSSCGDLSATDKASYVFNSFYQDQNQSADSCGFDGLANVVTKDPSTSSCNFTIGLLMKSSDLTFAPAPAPSDNTNADGKSPPSPGTHSGGIIITSDPRLWTFAIVIALFTLLIIPQM